MEIHKLLQVMKDAELSAGEMMLHTGAFTAHTKSDRRDIVTEVDEAVQQSLIASLSAAVPNAHFFCEEMTHTDSLKAEHVFVIDPIDGTMNFAHGLQCSCISVAYLKDGIITAATVYNPYLGELFSAIRGEGAFLNGQPIHAQSCGMNDILASVGTSPYYPCETDRTFRVLRLLYDRCLDIRRSGSAVLDLVSVAAGRTGIYYEGRLSFWDYAAGALIATESGAEIFTPEGSEIPTDGRKSGVVCGTRAAVKEFFDAKHVLFCEEP